MKSKKIALGMLTLFSVSVAFATAVAMAEGSAKVTAIDFKSPGATSELEITTDAPVTFEKQENSDDKQIILEIKGASLADTASRPLDTSSFNSKISMVSPYQVEGQPDTSRVVIQLREMAAAEVTQEGNVIRLSVPNDVSAASVDAPPAAEAAPVDAAPAASPATLVETPVEPAPAPEAAPATPAVTPAETKGRLEAFAEARETKHFVGKPITLQVQDADLVDVLRLIGEASGFNIVMGEDVRGKVTLSLVDVPWDQALDLVLHTKQLGAERNNNVLRIVTLANLTTEKQAELRAKQAAEATAPRVTRVFQISYAKLTDLKTILEKFNGNSSDSQSSGSSYGSSQTTVASTGSIQVDDRTNSLIVRDLPENIDKMKKLIEMLDTQTPQVMIEAKVVEASEAFARNISGSLGLGQSGSTSFVSSFAGGNPIDALIGQPGVFSSGGQVASLSSGGGAFGFSPDLTSIGSNLRLNALLNLGESENQVKIVSSPKTVVLNKERANIVQGTPVLVPGSTFVAGVGTVPMESVQSADLSLAVKPTVTNDGNILMDLNVSRSVPQLIGGGKSGIASRNMQTIVVVENGTTLVIGGIYTMSNSKQSSGLPLLRKIPIIGALFGSETEKTDRSELFIFITPRILNEKEAGMAG